MAVKMTGSVELQAPPGVVWEKLNDPEVLQCCIPGCESLEKDGDTAFHATAALKVGPMNVRFKGNVELSDLDPPHGYCISGEGQGGVAGFAKGGAVVRLEPLGEAGTTLSYDVTANVGGKMAQLGGRLLDSVAKKYADQFFAAFAATVPQPGSAPQDALGAAPVAEIEAAPATMQAEAPKTWFSRLGQFLRKLFGRFPSGEFGNALQRGQRQGHDR